MPSKEELMMVREYLQRKLNEDIFKTLYNQRDAFKELLNCMRQQQCLDARRP